LDLIEDAAVCEMDFVRLLPTADDLVEGEQFNFRELLNVFLHYGFVPASVPAVE